MAPNTQHNIWKQQQKRLRREHQTHNHFACFCRNGMWSVVDDSVDQSAGPAQYNFLDSSTMPHNNAMPNDGAAALEDLRGRLEKLMQL